MKKRYKNRCGICITTPSSTIQSNRISGYGDRKKLRITCSNGEGLEMACVNGIKNLRSIRSDAQPKSSSSQQNSLIVKGKRLPDSKLVNLLLLL